MKKIRKLKIMMITAAMIIMIMAATVTTIMAAAAMIVIMVISIKEFKKNKSRKILRIRLPHYLRGPLTLRLKVLKVRVAMSLKSLI
jgi:hypothetical protein